MSERTSTRPQTTEAHAEPHEAVTEPLQTPDNIDQTIEAHQGLHSMKEQARRVFEFNTESGVGSEGDQAFVLVDSQLVKEKKELRDKFFKKLGRFHTAESQTVQDHFPDQAQRENIVGRMLEIAETPLGYIQDTPELSELLDQAREISVIYVGQDPDKQAEKDQKQAELGEKLGNFYDNSPIGPTNKRAINETIWEAAQQASAEDMQRAHRVQPDDLPDNPPTLDPEANRKRQLHLDAMEKINAADRLRGYERVKKLGDLALELNAVDMGFGDLGVIAAKRIKRSGTRGVVGQVLTRRAKSSDFYLHRMAVTKGNVNAANAMAHGGYMFDKSIYKGRNDALREVALKQNATSDEGLATVDDLISNMRGLRGGKYKYLAETDAAETRAEPERLTAVIGMYDLFKKEEAKAKVAVAMAKKGDIKGGQAVAMTLKFRKTKRKALYDISKFIPNPRP